MEYAINYNKKLSYIYIFLIKVIEVILLFIPKKKNKQLKETKRILIVRPDHLGDAIISTSILKPLRDNYQGVTIDVICGSWSKEIYENSDVDNIYLVDSFSIDRSSVKNGAKIPKNNG